MAKPNVISRNDLIQSAQKCLVEQGVDKFTLKAVAEMGGVTQGTVYYHFRTKEQLLLEVVKDICDQSWGELSEGNENIIQDAIKSAKSRCSHDSFYHKLFFILMVSGFNNEKIREQLGNILMKENTALNNHLLSIWSKSPIEGVSMETWGIFFNAIVDGLALQALLSENFPVEKIYNELDQLFVGISNLQEDGGK